MTIVECLFETMKSEGVTVDALAKRMGVDRTTIARWKGKGRTVSGCGPAAASLERAFDVLGYDLDAIKREPK